MNREVKTGSTIISVSVERHVLLMLSSNIYIIQKVNQIYKTFIQVLKDASFFKKQMYITIRLICITCRIYDVNYDFQFKKCFLCYR